MSFPWVIFIILVLVCFAVLFYVQADMEYDTELESELARNIEGSYKSTGADNVVTAVLLDFRAFDTLGEILVLYVATTAVSLLSRTLASIPEDAGEDEMEGADVEEDNDSGGDAS